MYQISFPPTSNRATWIFTGAIMDAETNEMLDISDLSFTFCIKDKDGCQKLLATTDNGKFTVIDTGLFRWEFAKEEMRCLCAGTYETGLTMARTTPGDEQSVQLSVGPLPIVDGNVP